MKHQKLLIALAGLVILSVLIPVLLNFEQPDMPESQQSVMPGTPSENSEADHTHHANHEPREFFDDWGRTPAAPDAHAFFVNLQDGDTITMPFTVRFGLEGMQVAPAETYEENTGHFHLLINTEIPEEFYDDPILTDDQHIHFGGGETETVLELEPGEYRLQLVMGDGYHVLHDPPVKSDIITVTVIEDGDTE